MLLSLQLSLGSPSYLVLTLFSFPPNMNQHRATFLTAQKLHDLWRVRQTRTRCGQFKRRSLQIT
jgi:hypothetical protein